MTKDEILKMEAGRELDALVAEKVMRLSPCDAWQMFRWTMNGGEWIHRNEICQYDNKCYPAQNCPYYSTDITAAWEVVVKMENDDYWWTAEDVNPNSDPVAYSCTFSKNGKWYTAEWDFSMPLAICKSALLAVLGEKK